MHNNLGTTWVMMGRLEEAVTEHRLAIRYAPWYAEAHGNLGAALQRLGRTEEAAAAYRRALELKPELGVARTNLAVILHQQNQPDAALAELRQTSQQLRAASRNPQSFDRHSQVANAYLHVGRFADAAAEFEAALRVQARFRAHAPRSRHLALAAWQAR